MDVETRHRTASPWRRELAADTTPLPDGRVALSIHGELDIATEATLGDLLFAARARYGPHIVLDLSSVTFCDVAGLRAVLDCAAEARGADGTLVLTAIPDQMLRVMEISALVTT